MALQLIGHERSYQIIKNKNKICVDISVSLPAGDYICGWGVVMDAGSRGPPPKFRIL